MSLFSSLVGQSSQINANKTNKWEDELDSIYKQISTRDKFKYDMNADALYKQYAQQYENNAKLAMQDTVGQISALTGGYGNSYAETAGQAMYNQQMQGLNDRALELYQLALNQYNAEGDRLMNIYGMTADQYNTEYNKIRDEVADQQWAKAYEENQRQYNLGLAMDAAGLMADTAIAGAGLALDATQFGADMAFDISRAKASDAQWQAAFDYQRYMDALAYGSEYGSSTAGTGQGNNETKPVEDESDIELPVTYNAVKLYAEAVGNGIEGYDASGATFKPLKEAEFEPNKTWDNYNNKFIETYDEYLRWALRRIEDTYGEEE